jgi:hypothetical protein
MLHCCGAESVVGTSRQFLNVGCSVPLGGNSGHTKFVSGGLAAALASEGRKQPADQGRAADDGNNVNGEAARQHGRGGKRSEAEIDGEHSRDDLRDAETAVGGALIIMGAMRSPDRLPD